jgi:hypothetical protein
MTASAALAASLTPAQRHVVLRCSDAQEWGGADYGFTRNWPDLVYGRYHVSCRTIYALIRLGVMRRDSRHSGFYGLTGLGLSVQLQLQQRVRLQVPLGDEP